MAITEREASLFFPAPACGKIDRSSKNQSNQSIKGEFPAHFGRPVMVPVFRGVTNRAVRAKIGTPLDLVFGFDDSIDPTPGTPFERGGERAHSYS